MRSHRKEAKPVISSPAWKRKADSASKDQPWKPKWSKLESCFWHLGKDCGPHGPHICCRFKRGDKSSNRWTDSGGTKTEHFADMDGRGQGPFWEEKKNLLLKIELCWSQMIGKDQSEDRQLASNLPQLQGRRLPWEAVMEIQKVRVWQTECTGIRNLWLGSELRRASV